MILSQYVFCTCSVKICFLSSDSMKEIRHHHLYELSIITLCLIIINFASHLTFSPFPSAYSILSYYISSYLVFSASFLHTPPTDAQKLLKNKVNEKVMGTLESAENEYNELNKKKHVRYWRSTLFY